MSAFGVVLIGVFAVGFFVFIHWAFWRRYYWRDSGAQEIHRVQCDDGAVIEMYRTLPESPVAAEPIILCCGIATNQLFMDLTPELSLVRYLSSLGFDVWCLDPRGVGNLSRPRWFSGQGWQIHFEDFVDLDAPAAIRRVLEETGAARVHWVGFSQGGMIGSAFAQGPGGALLASLTVLGSPGWIKVAPMLRALMGLLWVLALLPFVPLALLARIFAPFYIRMPFDVMVLRQENMDTLSVRLLLSNGVDDIPMSLAFQGAGWASRGDIVASRDDRNFTQGMSLINVPLLAIAGDEDQVAPPASVRFIYDKAQSARKHFVNLGGAEGEGNQSQPYGHCDLILGRRAPRDVFARVARFVAEIAGVEVALPEIQLQSVEQGARSSSSAVEARGAAAAPVAVEPDAAEDDLGAAPMEGYDTEPEAASGGGTSAPSAFKAGDRGDDPGSRVEAPVAVALEPALVPGFVEGAAAAEPDQGEVASTSDEAVEAADRDDEAADRLDEAADQKDEAADRLDEAVEAAGGEGEAADQEAAGREDEAADRVDKVVDREDEAADRDDEGGDRKDEAAGRVDGAADRVDEAAGRVDEGGRGGAGQGVVQEGAGLSRSASAGSRSSGSRSAGGASKLESAAARLLRASERLDQGSRVEMPEPLVQRGRAGRLVDSLMARSSSSLRAVVEKGEGRRRPERLHRAPVERGALEEALALSASRVRGSLSGDPDDDQEV